MPRFTLFLTPISTTGSCEATPAMKSLILLRAKRQSWSPNDLRESGRSTWSFIFLTEEPLARASRKDGYPSYSGDNFWLKLARDCANIGAIVCRGGTSPPRTDKQRNVVTGCIPVKPN